jgi:hypothetical protein
LFAALLVVEAEAFVADEFAAEALVDACAPVLV